MNKPLNATLKTSLNQERVAVPTSLVEIKAGTLIVVIDGRDAIPVRAIPYVAGWENLPPDFLTKQLTRFSDYPGLQKTSTYHLVSGVPVPISQRDWQLVATQIKGVEADLQAQFSNKKQGEPKWQLAAISKIPADAFFWRDEFEKDFNENVLQGICRKSSGDYSLIYTPMLLDDDLRAMVFEGFQKELQYVQVAWEQAQLEEMIKTGWYRHNKCARYHLVQEAGEDGEQS